MEISPEQWEHVKDLYEAALECDPPHRADFLQRNSADELVRKEVLRLLSEHDTIGSFLSTPPFVDHRLPAKQFERRFAAGEILAERFRIVNFIAAGGMGEVYEAEDLTLKENLAIKTIRPEVLQQNNALARFKREVQLARKVTHPNICRVFDLFWHKKTEGDEKSLIVFVSMELLKGETLSERIRHLGRLSPEEALPLINQIASGLDAAHRAGVVHRDLKPGNVILVPDGDENQIRSVITDFGLALRTGVDANRSIDFTESHGVFGTPAYMAPEQIEGKEVTKLADIYALGLIIYEMVTGEHAFPADTPLASAAKRLSDAIVSPKLLVPELSEVWDQTIVRCLQRDPSSRFSSGIEVARALSGQTASTSDSRVDSVSTSFWRNKPLLGFGTLLLAAFFLVASFSIRYRRSDDEPLIYQPTHKEVTFLGNADMPAISPDGTFVAYVTSPPGTKQKLMLQDLSGNQQLELLQDAELQNPVWSADGSEIVVRALDDDPAKSGLRFVSRLGGTPQFPGFDYWAFCELQNQSQIVGAFQDPDSGVWLVDRRTGQKKKIPTPKYQTLRALDCSSKVGLILLLTKSDDKYQIWEMKSDGKEQRMLIEEQKEISSPRWAPSGDAIYYLRSAGDATDLVKHSISGRSTGATVLATGLETGSSFSISSDGSQLAYTRAQSYSALWSAGLPTKLTSTKIIPKLITTDTFFYESPSFSPDGRWIALVVGSNAKTNIYKMKVDTGQMVQLTFFDAATSASPAWSPDGRRIAYICNQGGTFKVWLVDANGGITHPLDNTNASDTNNGLAWFPSPQIVYQQSGLHNLRRLSVDMQKDEPVLSVDSPGYLVTRPKFSPNGKSFALLWNRPPEPGLWAVTPESHLEKLLSTNYYWAAGWASDGHSLYAGEFGGHEIVQIDLDKPKTNRTVFTLPDGLRSGSVSPDGRQIIVSVNASKSDVWLMKDFDPQVSHAKRSSGDTK